MNTQTTRLVKSPIAAEKLAICPKHLKRLTQQGRIACIKISPRVTLYEEEELKRFIDSNRVGEVQL